jgi:hypothetical protein
LPFIKIQPKIRAISSIGGSKVTIGAYLAEGVNKPRSISIRIPYSIVEETNFLEGEGKHKMILGLHEGVGSDTGFFMLYLTDNIKEGSSATQGHKKGEVPSDSRQGFTVSYRYERFQYYTPNEWPTGATECDHMIDDGNLIIAVPDWFKPNIEKMKQEGLVKEDEPPKRQHVVNLGRQHRRR